MRILTLPVATLLLACHAGAPASGPRPETGGSRYLFVWAGDDDHRDSDFLAVIDVDPRSTAYATVVATVPVGDTGTHAHHTDYEMPADGMLWASGFHLGRTYRFDLHDPLHPRLAGSFDDAGAFSHPHSYLRLPNGDRLATFQRQAGPGAPSTGGLAELDTAGRVVRSSSAAVPAIDSGVRPYSLTIVPALDRVITTATDMYAETQSRAVQIWRLSDLTLLHTILLPQGPRGDEAWLSAEPRVLEDGRTVLVNTFTCGLYRLDGIASDTPSATWVRSSPWTAPPFCSVPVVVGHFWIQPSGPEHALVSLDVSDPARPREVSRLTLQPNEIPHWVGREPAGDRLVITGYKDLASRILMVHLDGRTGALQLDSTFRTPGAGAVGVNFDRQQWSHGATGRAIPHGAVFSRP